MCFITPTHLFRSPRKLRTVKLFHFLTRKEQFVFAVSLKRSVSLTLDSPLLSGRLNAKHCISRVHQLHQGCPTRCPLTRFSAARPDDQFWEPQELFFQLSKMTFQKCNRQSIGSIFFFNFICTALQEFCTVLLLIWTRVYDVLITV
jgi:hypothetical protein